MVEDEFDEDDGEAGPELPPDFEEDIPDDEEGRFFGGGMEQKTAQAMQYIDQNEEEEAAVCIRGIQPVNSVANKLSDTLAREIRCRLGAPFRFEL
jgi:hypothetical protein